MKRRRLRAVASALALTLMGAVHPLIASPDSPTQSIADLSIEQLMNVEVVTVSKKPQRLSDTAAAAFVITNDDIRRSGAPNVPELLRLVPGVEVAWIGGGAYSVTIRGFSGRFADKLLVLQDGRSLYTSLFAGVFWERELPLMQDIERIEVIRGPGAAVWGVNAVNGVINIITKSARDSQGVLAGGTVGDAGQRAGFIRAGAAIDAASSVKVYARAQQDALGDALVAGSGADATRNATAGARYDRDDGRTRLTVQGEWHQNTNDQPIDGPTPSSSAVVPISSGEHMAGGDAIATLDTTLSTRQHLNLQAQFSHEHEVFEGLFLDARDVASIEAQDHLHLGAANEAMIGLSAQSDADHILGSPYLSFNPGSLTRHTESLLLQDEAAMAADHLHVTLGAIVQNDSLIDTHVMPDARLALNLGGAGTLWVSASKALRAPSRVERSVTYLVGPTIAAAPPYVPLPVIPTAFGSSAFTPEYESALQAGYRNQLTANLSVDVAAFYSHYTNLRTGCANPAGAVPALLGGVPYLQLPILICNTLQADSRGVEVSVDWRASDWWRLTANVSTLGITANAITDTELDRSNTPHLMATVRSDMDIGATHFDIAARYVDSLHLFTNVNEYVPGYTAFDARWSWRPTPHLELAIKGTNLFGAPHVEFYSDHIITPPLEATRTFLGSFDVWF